MSNQENMYTDAFPIGKIFPFVVVVVVLMLSVSSAIEWYADEVSLPRYCENPEEALRYLKANLQDERPAGDGARRPYLIAAKLIFLVPRDGGESLDDYLDRVELEIRSRCG
ncbi:MAG: hypothetical protein H8D24_01040 [Gammaproteobacteria bacterium]|uniref:Uncharacterized protein n=1 Tax=Candidatus Thiopontia autotrophica TaxID=2841688 RepID=A0A8J6PAD7_9GAMM|nr:hypothetical protein [Candidatus Thiopontia autotrophica]MBL6968717.1 hypothetical protein [Gammaproteobacteria bacterium]